MLRPAAADVTRPVLPVSILFLVGLLLLTLPGCGLLPRRAAVPPLLTQKASVLDSSAFRFWPNISLDPLFKDAADSNDRERADLALRGLPTAHLPAAYYLAISGGGDAGAFGAGILVGWTKRGNRPEFKVVTGVSAGALIAPFAFLGSRYDNVLHDVAVSIGPKDVFHVRNYLSALWSDAFADDEPLAIMIEKYVTSGVLADVAKEYARGRMLLVGTTDLDSGQPVIWNMGAIASSDNPDAPKLFRKIMLASASIPGIFPPVMIDVLIDGTPYQEMHVDGGVMNQVFLFPPTFVQGVVAKRSLDVRERRVYVVRNGRTDATWQSVARRSTSVARRALDGLIDAQGINDLYRLEVVARQEGEDFNLAYIGDDFSYPHKTMFDSDYLRHLFQYAFELAAEGNPWRKSLPGDEIPAAQPLAVTAGPQGRPLPSH
jgi:predicted acylesterase/phospholipase RssA